MPDAQGRVQLTLRERPLACRDSSEDLAEQLHLPERHVIVNTKIDLHGYRAHLH